MITLYINDPKTIYFVKKKGIKKQLSQTNKT